MPDLPWVHPEKISESGQVGLNVGRVVGGHDLVDEA
jgi:hypothetical protein